MALSGGAGAERPMTERGPEEVPTALRSRWWRRSTAASSWLIPAAASPIGGHTYAPMVTGLATAVRYTDGRCRSSTGPMARARRRRRLRPSEPAADRQQRPAEPQPRRRGPQWGATLGNAVQVWRSGARRRQPRKPHLCGCQRPDGRIARDDHDARGRGAGDGDGHQRLLAELHHLHGARGCGRRQPATRGCTAPPSAT